MTLPTLMLHIVPIQVTLVGSTATIKCNDSRAKIIDNEIEFRLNALNPKDPPLQQQVCFVVEDPPDAAGYDNYLKMSSGPPLGQMVAWQRTSSTTSRSPEMLPGQNVEVVVDAFRAPQPNSSPSTAVQSGHGRRRFKIRDSGAPGDAFD